MRKASTLFVAFILLISLACKNDKKETETSTDGQVEATDESTKSDVSDSDSNDRRKKLKLRLEPRSDSSVSGNVVFEQTKTGVTMVAIIGGLSEGTHAIHLHEKSDCSSSDGKSTGGHWNPTAKPHGKWGAPEGYHKGDIGNFTADANGNGTITFITSEWCIGCEDPSKDILGKAVIVHQGTDDFTSQPSGAAGIRVSCAAVIE